MKSPYFDIICKQEGCDSTISIELNRIAGKEEIICPNCDNKFPAEKFDSLKQLAKSFLEIRMLKVQWDISLN